VRYYFVRDKFEDGTVEHVASQEQVADVLTKPLTKCRFQMLRDKREVKDLDTLQYVGLNSSNGLTSVSTITNGYIDAAAKKVN